MPCQILCVGGTAKRQPEPETPSVQVLERNSIPETFIIIAVGLHVFYSTDSILQADDQAAWALLEVLGVREKAFTE